MRIMGRWLILLGLAGCWTGGGWSAETVPVWDARDYTFLWWANGWRNQQPVSQALLCVQTGRYGLALDVDRAEIVHFGRIARPPVYVAAASQGNAAVFALPKSDLDLAVTVGGRRYVCARAVTNRQDSANFPVRIIESGRFVQRCDLLQLAFVDARGETLAAEGRLELVAWPDRLSLILEVTPRTALPGGELSVSLGSSQMRQSVATFEPGRTEQVVLSVAMGADQEAPADAVSVAARAEGQPVPTVEADAARGWTRIGLPAESWSVAQDLDRLDRYRFCLANPSNRPRVFRLLFDARQAISAITGGVPMLRTVSGEPTGYPVQMSKNWHRQENRRFLYEGSWVHAFTLIRVPPGSTNELEFAMTYGRWGGVPAASHAQLCLIGWGWNQLWDESALGAWGETICYEPDAIQVRCMIDDVRPLMVWGMTKTPRHKYAWSNNVGGGDFLVYEDGVGMHQPMVSVRTAYQTQGPNLTDVTYAGRSADGHIAMRVGVSLTRSDDIVRGLHRFRYDVLKPTPFKRLAFYQLGSDGYLWHQFGKLARGNETGLLEAWTPKPGGGVYDRCAIPCPGRTPWFALYESVPADHGRPVDGAWADRGLVIRSWKARLGGRPAAPFAAVYGTQAHRIPSSSLELVPPPGVTQLQPGDYVEAEVAMLILPMKADDYYGPNEALRAALATGGGSWQPVLREAVGNDLRVEARRGRVLGLYPLVIAVDRGQTAEIAVAGGIGYVPVVFGGLDRPVGYELLEFRDGGWKAVEQAVHGGDFWQTDVESEGRRWRQTYNLAMDGGGNGPGTRRFLFRPRGATDR